MPPDHSAAVKFEIEHVLVIDIIGYSKLLIDEQSEMFDPLRNDPRFQKLIVPSAPKTADRWCDAEVNNLRRELFLNIEG
jgi:hypothetical protein